MLQNGHQGDLNIVTIKDAMEGNEKAFKHLYDTISGKMYGVCMRYSKTKDEANDMFQDGFLRLYRYLPNYRFEGSFEGWARRIFVTNCLDYLKKRKINFSDVDQEIAIYANEISATSKLQNEDLLKVLDELPEKLKIIVNLALIEEYSHKEIGDMLSITESNSKSKLHKARKLLKNRLIELDAF